MDTNCYEKCDNRSCESRVTRVVISGSTTSTININRSLFVDSQFGDNLTAERENLGLPYQTIASAYSIALPGDTVYVQPGDYILDDLVLQDQIDIYFTDGSNISSISNMFTIEDDTTMSILGYGRFEINGQSLLNITGESDIKFQGLDVTVTSGEFVNSASTFNLQIDVQNIDILSGTGMLLSGAHINIVCNFDIITTSTTFLDFIAESNG